MANLHMMQTYDVCIFLVLIIDFWFSSYNYQVFQLGKMFDYCCCQKETLFLLNFTVKFQKFNEFFLIH